MKSSATGAVSRAGLRRIAAAIGMATLLLAGCRREFSDAADLSGVLRLTSDDEIPTLDPARGYDDMSWRFELLLFATLLDYDDGVELVPGLARSFEMAPDGRSVALALREDARFSNGRPVVADDVRYAIERVLRPATRSPGAEFFRGIVGARDFIEGRTAAVTGIVVEAPRRLSIELESPDPLFLHKLAMPFAAPVPVEEVERRGEDFARFPIGAGPFRLVEWRPGERLVLERVGSAPGAGGARGTPVRRIEQYSGVSDQLAWLKLESGEIDISDVPAAQLPRLRRDPTFPGRLISQTQLATRFLGLNCEVPPLDRREVRQAIGLSLDRAKLAALSGGRGELASTILPPGMPGYSARPPILRAPDRARELLRASRLDAGFESTLWVRNDPESIRMAESVVQDLAEVGIAVRIKPVSWSALLEATRTPKLVPMFLIAWQADFPDPANFLEVLFHSRGIRANNESFFSDASIDRALDAAASMVPSPERFARYATIEAAILDAAPRIPLYHSVAYAAVGPRVLEFRLHPMRPARLDRVLLRD